MAFLVVMAVAAAVLVVIIVSISWTQNSVLGTIPVPSTQPSHHPVREELHWMADDTKGQREQSHSCDMTAQEVSSSLLMPFPAARHRALGLHLLGLLEPWALE